MSANIIKMSFSLDVPIIYPSVAYQMDVRTLISCKFTKILVGRIILKSTGSFFLDSPKASTGLYQINDMLQSPFEGYTTTNEKHDVYSVCPIFHQSICSLQM